MGPLRSNSWGLDGDGQAANPSWHWGKELTIWDADGKVRDGLLCEDVLHIFAVGDNGKSGYPGRVETGHVSTLYSWNKIIESIPCSTNDDVNFVLDAFVVNESFLGNLFHPLGKSLDIWLRQGFQKSVTGLWAA
jgi:hypothetical protein